MIDVNQKKQIKYLVSSPQWSAVDQLAVSLCGKISGESPVRDTEWETLKTTLGNEGMVRGIQFFLQELWKAQNDTI